MSVRVRVCVCVCVCTCACVCVCVCVCVCGRRSTELYVLVPEQNNDCISTVKHSVHYSIKKASSGILYSSHITQCPNNPT